MDEKVQAAVAKIVAGKEVVHLCFSLTLAHVDALVAAVHEADEAGNLGLQVMNLGNCILGDAGALRLCLVLARCKKLKTLSLYGNRFTAVAVQAIAAALMRETARPSRS